MNSSRFVFIFVILLCCNYEVKVQSTKQKVLTFNPQIEQLVDINPVDGDPTTKLPFITACPASPNSEDEIIFNQHASVTRNSLFLQKVYTDEESAKLVELNICDQSPTPQLVYNDFMEVFQIGYELFYEEGEMRLEYENYDQLKPVKNVFEKPIRNPNPNEKYIIYEGDAENTWFRIIGKESQKPMVYYWIDVMGIEINTSDNDKPYRVIAFAKNSDSVINYTYKTQTMLFCKMYHLEDGKNLNEEKPEVQSLSFNDVQNKEHLQNENVEEEITDRLQKTQILPMQMFHTFSARLATCTYLNFAFIWNTIANQQLKEVDLYLHAIHQLWPEDIQLYFGVSGELNGISSDDLEKIKAEDANFLKFPVPQLIHRVVKYTVQYTTYQVIIVIHNNANPIPETDRLCAPDPKLKSWEIIATNNTSPATIYACRLTYEIIKETGYYIGLQAASLLRLDKFPEFDHLENKVTKRNVLEDISKKVELIRQNNTEN